MKRSSGVRSFITKLLCLSFVLPGLAPLPVHARQVSGNNRVASVLAALVDKQSIKQSIDQITRAPRDPLPISDGTGNVGNPPANGDNSLYPLPSDLTITGNLSISQLGITLREDPSNGQDGVTLRAAASMPASYILTLPATDGFLNQYLGTNGSGQLFWGNPGIVTGGFVTGGNAFGGAAVLGTLDNNSLTIRTGVGGMPAQARMVFAAAGDITLTGLAGLSDRYVQTDSTGKLTAILPTGIKNTIQVIKDHPTITGKYYPDISSAIDWANANATEPTTIVIESGRHSVATTLAITNPFIRGIQGASTGGTILVPTIALVGQPVFSLRSNIALVNTSLHDLSVDGTQTVGYRTTPGSVGVLILGEGDYDIAHLLVDGCYRGIMVDGGGTANGAQQVTIVGTAISLSGDCGLLCDNGACVIVNGLNVSRSVNQEVRAQKTNVAAAMTEVVLDACWLTDDAVTGTADGVLARDTASVRVSDSRVYDVQRAFVVENAAYLYCVANTRVDGIDKNYSQVDGTADIQVIGDLVGSSALSKFLVTNSDKAYFDILDVTSNEREIGQFADKDYVISKMLTNYGVNDPTHKYVTDWFGFRGEAVELTEVGLDGKTGVRVLVTHNKPAYLSSFIRGLQAHQNDAGVVLATYGSDGDPATPDWSKVRSWRLTKRANDHALTFWRWNGAEYLAPFILTADGKLGLDATGLLTTPTSQLQLGSGQVSVPAGDPVAPSYSFTGDLNTGLYSPGADTIALSTNGLARLSIGGTGLVTISNLVTVTGGVVHADPAGSLSSSPVSGGDIADNSIPDSKLQTITTAGKVANGATTATTASTLNTIVLRDGVTGGFSAGTISANLSGTVTGSLSGAASLNVLKAGDTMTGPLILSGTDLTVTAGGTTRLQATQTDGLLTVNNGVYFLNGAPCLPQNVLEVTKGALSGPNQFNSITAAMASVVGNTAANPFVIQVGPGLFIEDTITTKPYVVLVGFRSLATIVRVDSPMKDVIIAVPNTYVSDIQIEGATGTGKAGVVYHGGGGAVFKRCAFGSNDILVKQDCTVGVYSYLNIDLCSISSTANFTAGFQPRGSGFPVSMQVDSLTWTAMSNAISPFTVFDLSGSAVVFAAHGLDLGPIGTGFIGGTCLSLADGAFADLQSSSLHGFTTAIDVPNVGSAPELIVAGTLGRDNSADISIQHLGTTGAINGVFDQNKVLVVAGAPLCTFFSDLVRAGTVTVGPIFAGTTTSQVTNISNQIQQGANLGRMAGGVITPGVGLLCDVAPGSGYVMVGSAPNDYLKYVTWTAQSGIPLTDNTGNYIYVDSAEPAIVHAATTEPDPLTTIMLGKLNTAGGTVIFPQNMPLTMNHTATALNYSWTQALGPIYVSGSGVSENTSTIPSGLNVSAGNYFYGAHEYNPGGGTGISWIAFYKSGASGNYVTELQSTVDYQRYNYFDGGTSTWARGAIPVGNFTRHGFYVVNGTGGAGEQYLLVYGQTAYPTIADALSGAMPIPPNSWTGNIAPIASIIVPGNPPTSPTAYIAAILDERPRVGIQSGGTSGTITQHDDLSGRNLDTNHLQYLLVSGTRAMTGGLNMGTNSITNVNLVDGVDVSAHASRHLPGGFDALAVGTAPDIESVIDTASQAGILASFARSDHKHYHGVLGGGSLHAVATPNPGGTAGFMSAADKTILDSVNPALYVLKAGDTMTGTLNLTPVAGNALVVNANKFIVAGTTGDTTIAGTLGVTGAVTLSNLVPAGVVHNSAAGLLSTRLIVDGDIEPLSITDSRLAEIATADKVANSATTATALNIPNKIVARDGSGNFAAGTITLENQGQLRFNETTVGGPHFIALRAPALVTADTTLTLPNGLGLLDQVLKTDVSGNLGWADAVFNGGNTVTGAMTIGSLNNYGVNLVAFGLNRLEISNAGVVTIPNLATAGVVHNAAGGALSSSKIVNDDVSDTAAIVDTKLYTISTSGKVLNTATTATAVNNPDTIVLREALTGNFAAGTITATFSGNLTGSVTGAASLNVLKAGDTMTGNLVMANAKEVRLSELTTSGTNFMALRAPDSVTANTYLVLPDGPGNPGEVLTTNGVVGPAPTQLSWNSPSALGAFVNGGNSFGATATLGTNDTQPLNLETDGKNRLAIDTTGTVTYGSKYKLAAYRSSGAGNQVIGAASATIIFDSEVTDLNNNYDNTTGFYTAPATGCYWVSVYVCFLYGSTGSRVMSLQKNGIDIPGYSLDQWNAVAYGATRFQSFPLGGLIPLAVGDTLSVKMYGADARDAIVANRSSLNIHFMSFDPLV